MLKRKTRDAFSRISILLIIGGVAFTASCDSPRSSAEKTIEQHLKSPGIREVKIDFFHTDPNFPDKAYISATVTHNFASNDGSFKKEYLGYILSREGEGWKIEKDTGYTKEKDDASTLLSGDKIKRRG